MSIKILSILQSYLFSDVSTNELFYTQVHSVDDNKYLLVIVFLLLSLPSLTEEDDQTEEDDLSHDSCEPEVELSSPETVLTNEWPESSQWILDSQ